MKLPYLKPIRFPVWSIINTKTAGNRRYSLYQDGIKSDFTEKAFKPHSNHVEMSGLFCSSIISYKVDDKRNSQIYRCVIFPTLRTFPNNTQASLTFVFKAPDIVINGKREKTNDIFFNGILRLSSTADQTDIIRMLYVAPDKKALIEEITFNCPEDSNIRIKNVNRSKRIYSVFLDGDETVTLTAKAYFDDKPLSNKNSLALRKGSHKLYIVYGAEELSLNEIRIAKSKRLKFIEESNNRLKITTPCDTINREIQFAKIRASESIFMTKNGLMHSPGGGNYYAALWTNDQCEYANPMFAYLGYDVAQEQSLNCYGLYSKLASDKEAVYTSIIAQGEDYWHGAGDRGDSSMFVYGFARYLLTTGDRENALKYLPELEKCCSYIMSKMNSNGVIESDSDELENRFESGRANLSTAVISYDAFISMHYIEKELENNERAEEYLLFAEKIREGISSYFECNVEGFDTYRYCAEETNLRSWICLPLTVGIFDRADGTLSALQSSRLKQPCGLLTRSGEKTFWDRSLLYALRGLFYAGFANEALDYLTEYTQERLLGEHVPYPVEAFPEGNAAHLSAESALYVRIFTEGVAGFRPISFSSFELKPCLPDKWNNFSIEKFFYAGKELSVIIEREGEGINLKIPELHYSENLKINQKAVIHLAE
ncbi:MAG: hypothetical protein ACI4IL_03225 [Eubacterium sp.]